MRPITEFNQERLKEISSVLNTESNVGNAVYELEKLGYMVFEGSCGKGKKCDALTVHKESDCIKVQLESGFGAKNYSKFVYFRK